MRLPKPIAAGLGFFLFLAALAQSTHAQNLTLRIVTYNIEDDINGATAPLPGLIYPSPSGATTNGGVLEGIGEEKVGADAARPIDIITLEETTSNPITVQPIADGLNAFYGARNSLWTNAYAISPYQGTESGGVATSGNGPNAIVYNTRTVQLLASVPVDPVGGTGSLGASSGEYREVMRYEFAPAGQTPTAATEFYIYVSHYKSGTGTVNTNDRSGEANIIRTNEALSLPATARVLYVGDYNVTTSGEFSYQTMLATVSPNGIAQGGGIDPLNYPDSTGIDWSANSLLNYKTESAIDLHYRDDFQICTTNIFFGSPGGLALVTNTYHTFGNNGTTARFGAVTDAGNTALTNLVAGAPISATQLFADLTNASDHLPVVADYTIPVLAPTPSFTFAPTNPAVSTVLTFTDTSTGIATNYHWSFGDGTVINTTNTLTVSHTYTNSGNFSVIETVTGPGGVTFAANTVIVTPALNGYTAWQLQYFGCTNCPQAATNADADGTGQNNYFKYIAGLNPTNPASVLTFSISLDTNVPPEPVITFGPAFNSRTYVILTNTDLTTSAWGAWLTNAAMRTDGGNSTITDRTPSFAAKYYSLQINYTNQ